jgi:hypothetical protein
MSKQNIWNFLNAAKVVAVQQLGFDDQQCLNLKAECDDLFRQATDLPYCPAWYIGGF